MFISIFGYLSLLIGLMILVLPLMLVELSRPRDWLIGGLFLFLGLFLLEENDLLKGSINLLLIAMAILLGKMMLEIAQTRWNQLSLNEQKRIASFERWIESLKQLGQIVVFMVNGFLNFFKTSKKSTKEKKWVHPELKDELNLSTAQSVGLNQSPKISNEESTENEETS